MRKTRVPRAAVALVATTALLLGCGPDAQPTLSPDTGAAGAMAASGAGTSNGASGGSTNGGGGTSGGAGAGAGSGPGPDPIHVISADACRVAVPAHWQAGVH